MSFTRKTPLATITRIYRYIQNGAQVTTRIRAIKRGAVYIAVPVYRPHGILKRMLWNLWGIFEIYTPGLRARFVRLLGSVSRRTPFTARIEALAGQQLNGNTTAPEAIARGAGIAVVDSRHYHGDKFIYVPNTDDALIDIAHHHRQQYAINCIGITGSCGKTTTKELIAAVMATSYRTVTTIKNFNTEQGVAHTVLGIGPDTEAAVVEIASDGNDSIAKKCEIVQPNIGIITNIGKAHLLGFGGPDGVAAAKKQLFDYMVANDGFFFANLDDPRIAAMIEGYDRIWTYGENPAARTQGIALDNGPVFSVRYSLDEHESKEFGNEYMDIKTQLFGQYNLSNVLATIAVGRHLGISLDVIFTAIEGYRPSNNRSQIIRHGDVTYIMDAYNANPTSMSAALDSFSGFQATRKMVILGDMLELDDSSDDEHRAVIRRLGNMQLDTVILVGKEFAKYKTQRIDYSFTSVSALREWMAAQDFHHASILIKGSQSIGLESILTEAAENG